MRPGRSERGAPAGPRRPRASARRGRRPVAVAVAVAVALAVPAVVSGPASPSALDARTGEAWPGRVLITNDDGIDAEPTRALARAFATSAETWVVAPSRNRSGSGSHLSALSTGRFEVERRELGDGITAYAVDGYPGDAVAFALLGPMRDRPPDLVISGINPGRNPAGAWFLSGTVGAARVATFLGVPALAVSGVDVESPDAVEAVARWVVDLAGSAAVRGLEPREYLTVSLPARDPRLIEGVEIVRRARRFLHFEAAPVGTDAPGAGEGGAGAAPREAWTLSLQTVEPEETEGTDLAALAGGRIALVPMRVGEEDEGLRRRLEALAGRLQPRPSR